MTLSDSGASVVLFGAGASAFSPGIRPKNPPLGKDLFSELVECFPEVWGGMRSSVAARFTRDFEDGMRSIWETYPKAVQPPVPGIPAPYELMQTMAVFFLQFEPDGTRSDLYRRIAQALLDAEKMDRVRLATLNYENLLEFALAAIGKPLRVIRPHGAANWWVHGVVLRVGVERALGAGLHVVGRRVGPIARTAVVPRMQTEGKYPAMAIYMPGKTTQMGQRRLSSHQARFKRLTATADRVAIIGVRPYPADGSVWDALARAPGTLYYVGDRELFIEWCAEFRPCAESEWLGPRFEGAIADLVTVL